MADNFQEWIERAKDMTELAKATGAGGWLSQVLRAIKNKSPDQPDWHSEAIQALRENAVETLANVTLTVEQALLILGSDLDWDRLVEPNQTWSNHWLSAVSKVGVEDQERHKWWSRLLAAEIQLPGTFSLRTIAVMDVLSPSEAQLFSKLAPYLWLDQSATDPALLQRRILVMPPGDSSLWRPDVNEELMLQSAGLVTRQAAGYSTPVDEGGMYRMRLANHVVTLSATKSGRIFRGPMILTEAGEQTSRLMDVHVIPQYLDELLKTWSEFAEVSIGA